MLAHSLRKQRALTLQRKLVFTDLLFAGVDAVTLARYANAVFQVCQGMLEAESTAPQLVPPLLEVVMQVVLKLDVDVAVLMYQIVW